ncbi:hypothetical protein FLONG3_8893 [Fusarium longipes]|uniref:Polycomb protein VEFS-Box domain-containing protein n=1 Tax=Fusarium longipes TaxID=694270 RepID=A0A395S209_9HYPO|nr:hypothetical protein FLONG3_8893 [Fusarium longipes]
MTQTQRKTYTRTAPFTQQSWLVTHNAKKMGGSFSAPKSHDDAAPPPQKRPRLSTSTQPLAKASPSDLENRSHLRVEIHKIFHKDSKKVRPLQEAPPADDIIKSKGKCQITVSDESGGFTNILYRISQSCDILSYKNPAGPHRIIFIKPPKPFLVPEETILVNRQDDASHDYSPSYKLDVELSSLNDGAWPPLNAQELGLYPSQPSPLTDAGKQSWVLHSEFNQVFARRKNPVRLTTGFHPQRPECSTDYVMDVDLRWTTGFRPIDKTAKNCITAVDPDAEEIYTNGHLELLSDDQSNGVSPVEAENRANVVSNTSEVNGTNGTNGIKDTNNSHDRDMNGVNSVKGAMPEPDGLNSTHDANGVSGHEQINEDVSHDLLHDMDEELEGDQTPNRHLRKRANNKEYNLKRLTAQAHGKGPKPRAKAGQVTQIEGRVTYLPPVNTPVQLDSWRCLNCGCSNEGLDMLHAHLKDYHPSYDYALEVTSEGPLFRVTRISGLVDSPMKTLQIGNPTKPFNLEDYNRGDDSWISSRLGPDHNDPDVLSPSKPPTIKPLLNKPATKPPQPLPTAQPAAPRPKKKKIIIPDSSQPLFDPISKARLKPGEELPTPVVESSWLIQKHREDIGEFSDVSAEEKEYICKWDAFILEQNVTSGAYFRRAWLQFVKENAMWLASEGHRMIEFGKHMCVLMARDVLDDQGIDNANKLIEEARARLKSGGGEQQTNDDMTVDSTSKQSSRASQITKGGIGCTMCKLPVLGPSLLICSNKVLHAMSTPLQGQIFTDLSLRNARTGFTMLTALKSQLLLQ